MRCGTNDGRWIGERCGWGVHSFRDRREEEEEEEVAGGRGGGDLVPVGRIPQWCPESPGRIVRSRALVRRTDLVVLVVVGGDSVAKNTIVGAMAYSSTRKPFWVGPRLAFRAMGRRRRARRARLLG